MKHFHLFIIAPLLFLSCEKNSTDTPVPVIHEGPCMGITSVSWLEKTYKSLPSTNATHRTIKPLIVAILASRRVYSHHISLHIIFELKIHQKQKIMKACNNIPCLLITTMLLAFSSMAQEVSFIEQSVSDSYYKPSDICSSDLNNDGFPDLITVGGGDEGNITWWKNDGQNNFEESTLYTHFNGARGVRSADLNNDGFLDIVAAAWEDNHIVYLHNNGDDTFTAFDVDTTFIGAHTIDLKDLNEDGYIDILCSGFDFHGHEGEIAWWENDGQNQQSWTKHLISERFQQSTFIYGEDIDGDSDLDILACGELNGEILWWENNGNTLFEVEHMIDSNFQMSHTVLANDIDNDGDMDILGAACMSGLLAWYENIDNEFVKHPLPSLSGAIWLNAADIDNDGDKDLFSAGMGSSTLHMYINDGEQNFEEYPLGGSFSSGFAINPIHMDNDNDLDFIAIGYNSGKISWFDNTLYGIYYNHPESCVFDNENHCWYISNTAGSETGNIIKLLEDGTKEIFIENIESPMGMCLSNGVLYVSNETQAILGFDVTTKENVLNIAFTPVGNFDGMASNDQGMLWVVDTGGKIYEVDLSASTYYELVNTGLTSSTQDIVYDATNNCLYSIGWVYHAPIQEISCETGLITNHDTPFSYYDGITIDLEGNLYLASHNAGGRIYKLKQGWNDEWSVISSGHSQPAGLHYNTHDHILAIPNYGDHTVDFFNLSPVGIKPDKMDTGIIVFPNPVQGEFRITMKKAGDEPIDLLILDIYGKKVMTLEQYIFGSPIITDMLEAGIYFVVPLKNNRQQKPIKVLIQ